MANKVNKKGIDKLINRWSKQFTILAPSREGVIEMAKWDGKDTHFLEWYRNTVVPPKASFSPPMEEMFHFKRTGVSYSIDSPSLNGQRQLVFGIRPCDAKALTILDKIFADNYPDNYYLSRRKNTVLVGLGCVKPYDSCFCTSLGSGPSDQANVDLMLTDIGEEFLIEEVSDKGRELLSLSGELEKATKADEERAEKAKEAAESRVTRKVDIKNIEEKLLAVFNDQAFWQGMANKCVSCGVCTFLCPTCYCFDISDEMVRDEGTRLRCWDSCSFALYTKMPMENPRAEKWRRVRQKVGHKYLFYPMNFNVIACTGCGRCIRQCPVNWDIAQALESIAVKT